MEAGSIGTLSALIVLAVVILMVAGAGDDGDKENDPCHLHQPISLKAKSACAQSPFKFKEIILYISTRQF